MAKGKRTYAALSSPKSKKSLYTINYQKKNLKAGEKITLRKYDKTARKHIVMVAKDIKKWS